VAGRITRKELKTDKFAVEVEHTVDYVAGHRRQLILYGSVAVVLAAIFVGIYWYMGHQQAVRARALADAIEIQQAQVGPPNPSALVTFPTEDAKRAAETKVFSEMAAKYSGSGEGAVAKYYLGSIAADQGKMAEAQKLFQDAAQTGDKNYASLARFSLAHVYLAEKRQADAEAILRDLMTHPTLFVSKEQATIELAKCIAATKPAEAKKLLEPLRAQSGPVSQAAMSALGDVSSQ
jgi:tetratricopeptide (TPR) repeat protein